VLATFYGPATNNFLGKSLAGAGDVNNDGVPDIIAGGNLSSGGVGIVSVYSGSNGTVLHSFSANGLGYSVCGAGDLNGDNYDDFIYGNAIAGPAGTNQGLVYVRSGLNGSVLFQISGANGDFLGGDVSSVGDLNQDGRNDFIVVASRDVNNNFFVPGAYASIRSGLDGTEFGRVTGPTIWHASGHGDIDGDGRMDFIETEWPQNQQPMTKVFSGVQFIQGLYPGTGEDIALLTGLSAAPDALETKFSHPNDWLEILLDSPSGTFDSSRALLVGQMVPTAGGVPTYAPIPAIHFNLTGGNPLLILFDSSFSLFGQPGIPPGGIHLFLGFIPPGLAGTSLILQGAAISSTAANQIFAATAAHEIRMLP
jgi:hypothetical protein